MYERTSRALAQPSCQRRATASSLQRPPVSMATTTKRQRPVMRSGVLHLFVGSGLQQHGSVHVCGRFSPRRSAMSRRWPAAHLQNKASPAPSTSMFLSSVDVTPTSMSRRRVLNFTRAPASLQMRAKRRVHWWKHVASGCPAVWDKLPCVCREGPEVRGTLHKSPPSGARATATSPRATHGKGVEGW